MTKENLQESKWFTGLLVFLSLIFLADCQSYAATINVGPNNDDLIAAINTANGNKEDDILILPLKNIYSFSKAYTHDADGYGAIALPAITSNIIIDGNGAAITRSQGTFRFFYIKSGQLTLNHLTIANGFFKGGNGGSASWMPFAYGDYVACGGGAAGMGGAIFNSDKLILEGVTMSGNVAKGGDGGFLDLNIQSGSGGTGGGGIGGNGGYGHDSKIADGGNGGGVNGGGGSSGYSNGDDGGVGGGGGGAGSCHQSGKHNGYNGGKGGFGGGGGGGGMAHSETIIIPIFGSGGHGSAGGYGGGGGGSSRQGNLGQSNIGGGAPGYGGGKGGTGTFLYAWGGGAGGGGGGAGLGGAIFNKGGYVKVTNCTFSNNEVHGGAGGTKNLDAVNHGKPGTGFGATVFNLDGTVIITNTTIAHNTGNAVYNYIENESASSASSKMAIRNTIIAFSSGGISPDLINHNDSKIFTGSEGENRNIVMNCDTSTCGIPWSNNDPGITPSLMFNGGPTAILALLKNSIAINNANMTYAPDVDQRLFVRKKTDTDPPDIGAHEYGAIAVTTTRVLVGPYLLLLR